MKHVIISLINCDMFGRHYNGDFVEGLCRFYYGG